MIPRRATQAARAMAKTFVNSLGFDVVRLHGGHSDLAGHLANVLRHHEIDCVLDVGANRGQYGEFLRKLGFRGFIISFEPSAEVFSTLQEKAKSDPKWHCYRLALGDRDEVRDLNVYDLSSFSSFLQANDYSKSIWSRLSEQRTEAVSVARLDGIFDDLVSKTQSRRFMLKMDTQGYDLQVFAGAAGVLDRISVLQSELPLIPVYDGMPALLSVLSSYLSADFKISGMYPINRDKKTQAVIEYDCVMVRHVAPTPASAASQ